MPISQLDPVAALVVIDLQKGVLAIQTEPPTSVVLERSARLAAAFRGVDTFYNTYWVRFVRGSATHELAVAHRRALITAAARAGVRRMVHAVSALVSAGYCRVPHRAARHGRLIGFQKTQGGKS